MGWVPEVLTSWRDVDSLVILDAGNFDRGGSGSEGLLSRGEAIAAEISSRKSTLSEGDIASCSSSPVVDSIPRGPRMTGVGDETVL
jgi:hypothetical protein